MVRMDKEIPMAKRMDRVDEVLKQVTSPVMFLQGFAFFQNFAVYLLW